MHQKRKAFDIYDLIPKDEYQVILEAVRQETEFEYNKTIDKFTLRLDSSTASCDWEDGTKKGDYLVGINIENKSGGYCGAGYAISAKEFLECAGDYEQCTKYFDRFISGTGILKDSYIKIEDTAEQLGFELGI